eukprot:TCONS_00046780-protein
MSALPSSESKDGKQAGYANGLDFLSHHYEIDNSATRLKISEIYEHFCQSFPNTSLKAFGSTVKKAFPFIEKKNSNGCAYYTNIKRHVVKATTPDENPDSSMPDLPKCMFLDKKLFSVNKRHVMDGATSSVFFGKYNETQVCIKQYKPNVEVHEVYNEAQILLSLPASEYLCFLVGVCLERPQRLVTSFFGSDFPARNTLDYHIKSKTVSIANTFFIIRKLLDAVSFLHKNNVFHGDIKPNNLLVLFVDTLKLRVIDFGCSSFISERENKIYNGILEEEKESISLLIKCNKHIAPEVHYGYPRSSLTDIYGIGYTSKKLISVNQSITTNNNKRLFSLIQKCLQLDPYKRPSILELQSAL